MDACCDFAREYVFDNPAEIGIVGQKVLGNVNIKVISYSINGVTSTVSGIKCCFQRIEIHIIVGEVQEIVGEIKLDKQY